MTRRRLRRTLAAARAALASPFLTDREARREALMLIGPLYLEVRYRDRKDAVLRRFVEAAEREGGPA